MLVQTVGQSSIESALNMAQCNPLAFLQLTSNAAAAPAEPSSLPSCLRRMCFAFLRRL